MLPHLHPYLYIAKLFSPHEEVVSKNGQKKTIHYVVKNTPFTLQLLYSDKSFTFSETSFEVSLLFDDDEEREVGAVRPDPMEYLTHILPDKKEVIIEVRIKVLSTQLENSLFVLRIKSNGPNGTTSLKSSPIRAVSKPEQIRRRKAVVVNPPPVVAKSKKRARAADVFEALEDLRSIQQQQLVVLRSILEPKEEKKNLENLTTDSHITPSITSKEYCYAPCSVKTVAQFEDAFQALMKAYTNLPREDRPAKIRKVIHESTNIDPLDISEAIVTFCTEGFGFNPLHFSNSEVSSSTSSSLTTTTDTQTEQEIFSEFFSTDTNFP
eukprot:TRINITY_DN3430_c0_g1_i2.p1 TRINITY_DN3430_c0_g1~~TRINITY_DN3430_c0_g1_i2.p1  ORF type:complete len:323 (+),score=33.58 TRINITY_DN3430_c0_g1_i2:71-1039(+)